MLPILVMIVFGFSPTGWLIGQQDDVIPRGQSQPPNRPYSPQEAIEHMTVPDGFSVELVASEPDLINPVAMTFDDQGRIWVCESVEYPRRRPGTGRDRVKVFWDEDGDGYFESMKVFADGLNIPSGIAIGHGGVWVANAPDILFMQDLDGDLEADTREVVVTGFGRDDTHELPNSLVWGPDGFLYGLNGVFNHSHVIQDDREYRFTCAMFRIDPRTHRFELFAEGTSNPWGIAWDPEGNAFLSACVIDHLWHLTETGYYHRQAGPYPPYTWKIESIVNHRHQQAAYCGIHYFDSDAYPEEYRDRLYMGNIHGNCINVDELERRGSTYHATGKPDFLSANDAWFMPVSQKTGPDGSLYILDWYDRYHCYQDANRDPEGIDRLKGRIYRVRYEDTPRPATFDLSRESTEHLIERLGQRNDYFRSSAQRVLSERDDDASRQALEAIVLDPETHHKPMLHALWALMGRGPLDEEFLTSLLQSDLPRLRTWGVRAAGNQGSLDARAIQMIRSLASDTSPDVRLQVAIAAGKIEGLAAIEVLMDVLSNTNDDPLIPRIVWQNLHPLLERESTEFVRLLDLQIQDSDALTMLIPRVVDRIVSLDSVDAEVFGVLYGRLASGNEEQIRAAISCLDVIRTRVQSGEITGEALQTLQTAMSPLIGETLTQTYNDELREASAVLAATWGDQLGLTICRQTLADRQRPDPTRLASMQALTYSPFESWRAEVEQILDPNRSEAIEFRGQILNALARVNDDRVSGMILAYFEQMEPQLKPRAIEMLTARLEWSKELIERIQNESIATDAVNLNQVRKMLALNDAELNESVAQLWGTIRMERNPDREQVIGQMRNLLRMVEGDPHRGIQVFEKVCGQCHKIYGNGFDVGPDITANGRGDFEQLLSNVFDPSLVIGADYQARTVLTVDGRVETGLLLEESDQRIVLRPQGSEEIIIAMDDVEELTVSSLSLMPEDLERQLTSRELADLFAFLKLDQHPDNEDAKLIPGSQSIVPRETNNRNEFPILIDSILPGFNTTNSGVGGVSVIDSYRGRINVLRTHPVSQQQPCVIEGELLVPEDETAMLCLPVGNDSHDGDWLLQVRINGDQVHEQMVGPQTTDNGWTEVKIPLGEFAGQRVNVELVNRANNWSYEFGYWGQASIRFAQDE